MKLKFSALVFVFYLYSQACGARDTVSIIGVGDIMLGTNYPSAQYLPPRNGRNLLRKVNEILRNADITFGNLEGAILNRGATIKRCTNCYAFRMPENLAGNLETAGFDILSIANNHARDFGRKGLDNTISVLENLGIKSAGLKKRKNSSVMFTKNKVKYGFAAFAPNIGTLDIRNLPKAKKIVRNLAKKSDIVIVSFHGGAEGSRHQHVPKKTEFYYRENRGNVHKFAHAVIDAGADVVFGHGPHVTRAVELYKNRFIAYSLGNFCTYGRFNLRGVSGVAPIIKVNMTKKGDFVNAKITPVVQLGRGGVSIDPQKRAIRLIRNLTKEDFPGNKLKIGGDGTITKK
ncbi:MAG: CapA family protein [Gammaproteobacteria bacterium]|nr:CapA family protein [Gammaproteobacteria bacterium]